ncbi:MAG TPA: PKD domain containing protein, partial [Ornithinibacter sp.]|nr:PKD domain containing protein [Ornithinibacter sp.]
VPATVVAGDGLLLVQSFNNAATIAGPAGWSLVKSVTASSETTTVWQRVAATSDAGSKVTVSASGTVKGDLNLLAYRGTSSAGPIAAAIGVAETVTRTSHTTPTATAGAKGTWVVSLWADKSSGTAKITPPVGVTQRHFQCTTGGGEICALSVDSNGPVNSGAKVGGLIATADVASANDTMWTILLAPGA